MRKQPRIAARATCVLAAALVLACARNPEPAGADALISPQLVPVRGSLLDSGPDGSVLDLLSEHLTSAALSGEAAPPLVIVDGMTVINGLELLSRVPADLTQSVRYMRPLEAVRLYGNQAATGAILVRLKSNGSGH